MRNDSLITLFCVLALLFPALACGSSEATSKNPFLENLLAASDDREFSKALSIYGSLQREDVETVVKATDSSSKRRRKNAALMLNLCRQDNCGEEQRTVVLRTKDVTVWTILIETAAKEDEKLLRERPELLTKALASEEPDLLAPALRVALKIRLEGIDDQVRKLLDSTNEKILDVVLGNLSAEIAKEESPRLARMLADQKTYGNVEMQIAVALIRGADSQYEPDIKAFVDRLKQQKSEPHSFNEAALSEDKQEADMLWKKPRMKEGDVLGNLRDHAYDALTRRVWAPSMHEPLQRELMEMTLGYLKEVSPDTNPRVHMNAIEYKEKSALDLIAFANNGNREHESYLYGKDAVAFAENWLKTHK